MANRTGDSYALGSSPSQMPPAVIGAALTPDMRYLAVASNQAGQSVPYIYFGGYPIGQMPSGGLISRHEDNTFTWAIQSDYPALFSATQLAAKFRHKPTSETEYTEEDIEDGTMSYTVPAETFTAASVDWQVQAQTGDGFWSDDTAWFTLFTGADSLPTAIPLSPINVVVDGGTANTFSWWHVIDTGTQQPTGADLEIPPRDENGRRLLR
jgi:hypothetical protein